MKINKLNKNKSKTFDTTKKDKRRKK